LQLAEEAQRHLANGFRRMKMRLGRSYEYDAEAVDCVKACIGAHNDLIIEGNARYTVEQARRMAERYRQHRVFWFEEPFPPEQIDNYLALRPNLGLRLAAGENEFGLQGFRELVDQATVDILQPDASRCGGITECYRVGQLAAKHGLKVATHSWSDAVAVVANMHVIAALANGITVEIDQTGNGLVNHLLTEPLRVADGEIALPHKPGLGVELDEEAVAQFTVSDDAIPDGNYSDMVFGKAYLTSAPPYDSVSASRRKEN
jgi:L-alanine-DL-glutamate epimerase-like enolase superfamily enzyme